MVKEYTLEQFESDFEDATFDEKVVILNKALDTFDVSDPDVKECLLKHKDYIQDYLAIQAEEENIKCEKDIESGNLQLFTCKNEVPGFDYKVGSNYYVKIDDVKSMYSESQFSEMSEEIKNYINGVKPVIWIYTDNGIGTLKYRNVFVPNKGEFSNYFEKYES